ncbi:MULTISPECIES: hypothetical protein [Klebsiella/Raoultella group]|uniref:hypothetical protein n=1 Tax=Klebsiella/Raoultella group TaxID=2890311 RepID=UPI001D0F4ACD|nr:MULTISPECIES: hypothetical protein [Klebsiella/Raoultella group]MDC7944412.1 hypothetical protein [Raoultella ornithinolytica]
MPDIATTINAIRRVAAAATQYTEILVPEWLSEGKRQGGEWTCRNPTHTDRHAGSFSVSLLYGRWHDFVTAAATLWRWACIDIYGCYAVFPHNGIREEQQ